MISGQHRVVLACLAVAESASVYAVLAMVGAAGGHGASPMNMPAVLAVLVSALVVSRVLLYVSMPDWTALLVHTGFGLLVIWVVVATQAGASGVEFGWVGWGFSSSPLADGNAFRAIIGGVASVFLWRRGAHLAASQSPVESLGFGFKVGVVIMTTAAVVDAIIESDLNIYSVMFTFLAASLAGLGIGRLLPPSPETEHARTWPKVIGAVVTGVVVTGLFVGLVQNAFLSQASRLAISSMGFMIDRVVKYALLAIIYPLAYVVGLLVSGLSRLFSVDEPRGAGDAGAGTASDRPVPGGVQGAGRRARQFVPAFRHPRVHRGRGAGDADCVSAGAGLPAEGEDANVVRGRKPRVDLGRTLTG